METLLHSASCFPVHFLATVVFLGSALVGTAFGSPVESRIQPPRPWRGNATPVYPRRATEPGAVILHFVVDDRGVVRDPQVLEGEEPFATAALNAVKRWRYEPARDSGRPVAVPWQIRLRFEPAPKKTDRWDLYRRGPRPLAPSTVAAR